MRSVAARSFALLMLVVVVVAVSSSSSLAAQHRDSRAGSSSGASTVTWSSGARSLVHGLGPNVLAVNSGAISRLLSSSTQSSARHTSNSMRAAGASLPVLVSPGQGPETAPTAVGQPPTGSPPPAPGKGNGAGVQPTVTNSQGDQLTVQTTFPAAAVLNQGSYSMNCFAGGTSVYAAETVGFCAYIQVFDSVSGSQTTTTNNQTNVMHDACGAQIGSGAESGFHVVGTSYFTTSWIGSQVWTVPSSGVCWGQWSETYTFTQTFTDGQQLTDSMTVPFTANLVNNPAPASSDSGGGDSKVHPTTCRAGDPVNCASGNFSETFTDAAVPGRGPALDLTRTYNSLGASTEGIFGYGWSSSYEAHVTVNPDGSATVFEVDGSQVTAVAKNGAYSVPAWADSTLTQNSDGSWRFVRQQGLIYDFSPSGKLTTLTDRNGYTTQLTYVSGNLTTVTDSTGRTITLTYGTNGLVSQVADPTTQSTSYGYDASGNLTSVTDRMNRATSFTYDANHYLLTLTDPNLGVTTNVYDTYGRVTQQTDPASLITGFAYTGDNFSPTGGTTTITDPHGSVAVEKYTSGVMTSITKASGTPAAETWTYLYDPNTFGISSVTDPNNHVTNSTYDSSGNLLTTSDALNHTTTYTYNSFSEPLTMTDPAGIKTTYTYDSQGNVLTKAVAGIGGTPVENTTYSYTDGHAGDVTQTTDPAGHVTDYTYDSQGDVASATTHPSSGVNNITAFVYDALGRKVCEASPTATAAGIQCPPAGSQPLARTTAWAYNADSELTSQTDPLGNTTAYAYDGDGNRTQVTDPIGNVTKTVYDLDSRKTVVTSGFGTPAASTTNYAYDVAAGTGACSSSVGGATYCSTTTDPSGQVTIDYFNIRSQQIQEVQPSSGTSASTFDPAGNLATLTTAGGKATYGYDAADQLTSITYSLPAAGYAAAPNVTYGYDADGHRTSMTDGTGNTSYTYDTLARLQSTTNGGGSVTSYNYDLDNEVTSITYPGSHTVTQVWDGAGRESSVTDWLSHTTNFSYDAGGNLQTEALPNTTTVSSTYDPAGNLLTTKDALNTTPLSPFASFTYTYNADSQVQTETDTGTPAPTSQTYSYDQVDRLSSSSSASYGYNTSGDPTQLGQATQSFNANHQLTSQTQAISRIGTASAGDAGTGATLTLTLPAGTGANDQILLAVTLPGSQSIKSTPSGYTAVGTYNSGTGASNVKLALYRRTAVAGDTTVTVTFSKTFAKAASLVVYRGVDPTTPIDTSSSGTTATGTSVTAPSLSTTKANDQLVIAEGAESSNAGSWTAPSAMTTRISQAGGPTTTGSIADQPLVSAGATGSRIATFSVAGSLAAALIALQPAQTTYTYDTLGDRKTVTSPSGATTLSYDQLGRMTAYGSTGYAYSGDGLRMSKTNGHTTESFSWQPSGPIVIPTILVDGSTNYVYGPDGLPLEQISGTTVLYYLHDQLGSTRALVGSSGAAVASYTYGAYGAVVGSTGTATNPFGFGGSLTDSESGLLYMQHRYYDSSTAQFASVDPLALLTQTPFVYVNGDPVNKIDPDGLMTIGVCVSGTGILGAVVGVTGSLCVQASSKGDVGFTASGGPIIGGGIGGVEIGPGVEISNANHISQLGGPFDVAGASAAYGPGAYGEGFLGLDSCGNPIYGGVLGPALGVGIEGHIGATETLTTSLNLPHLLHAIGQGVRHLLSAIDPL
jgi:RHS repeat-associated protein